jgi:hypothetical protein
MPDCSVDNDQLNNQLGGLYPTCTTLFKKCITQFNRCNLQSTGATPANLQIMPDCPVNNDHLNNQLG